MSEDIGVCDIGVFGECIVDENRGCCGLRVFDLLKDVGVAPGEFGGHVDDDVGGDDDIIRMVESKRTVEMKWMFELLNQNAQLG